MRLYRPPEWLPLPDLSPELLKEIRTTRDRLVCKLTDDLNGCWARVGREAYPQPDAFFPAFLSYGESLYNAYAETLLRLNPPPRESDFRNWIDGELKTAILEEIAPFWSPEEVESVARMQLERQVPNSGWEYWMRWTWQVAEPPKPEGHQARRLIESLRDYEITSAGVEPCVPDHHLSLAASLYRTMSRRVPHVTACASGNDSKPKVEAAPIPAGPTATGLRSRGGTLARSRSEAAEKLCRTVRDMKAAGFTQHQMCERFDAKDETTGLPTPTPERCDWGGLTWRKAFTSRQYSGRVKKWISKAGMDVTRRRGVTA